MQLNREDTELAKKYLEKALMNTYAEKRETLGLYLIDSFLSLDALKNISDLLEYINTIGCDEELKKYFEKIQKEDDDYTKYVSDIIIEYGKNGHELMSALTPVSEMTSDQLDYYIVKIKENTALKGEMSDEEICSEMLSVFTETGAILPFDVAKHISGSLMEHSELINSEFTIGLINGNYFLISKGNDVIAILVDKPNHIDRNTFMQIAESVFKESNVKKENLATTTLSDTQVRRRLVAYTFVAIKYQGIAREKELTYSPDTEIKKQEENKYYNTYDELIESDEQYYAELDKIAEKQKEEELEEQYENIEKESENDNLSL